MEDITAALRPHACGTGARTSSATSTSLKPLGYDERFRRIWTLYLAYCEAGFAERRICDVQLVLAKPEQLATSPAVSRALASPARPASTLWLGLSG